MLVRQLIISPLKFECDLNEKVIGLIEKGNTHKAVVLIKQTNIMRYNMINILKMQSSITMREIIEGVEDYLDQNH